MGNQGKKDDRGKTSPEPAKRAEKKNRRRRQGYWRGNHVEEIDIKRAEGGRGTRTNARPGLRRKNRLREGWGELKRGTPTEEEKDPSLLEGGL